MMLAPYCFCYQHHSNEWYYSIASVDNIVLLPLLLTSFEWCYSIVSVVNIIQMNDITVLPISSKLMMSLYWFCCQHHLMNDITLLPMSLIWFTWTMSFVILRFLYFIVNCFCYSLVLLPTYTIDYTPSLIIFHCLWYQHHSLHSTTHVIHYTHRTSLILLPTSFIWMTNISQMNDIVNRGDGANIIDLIDIGNRDNRV